jgi:hypothetical protein
MLTPLCSPALVSIHKHKTSCTPYQTRAIDTDDLDEENPFHIPTETELEEP